jgi:hypothetical protein
MTPATKTVSALALLLAGLSVTAASHAASSDKPLTCDITATPSDGMIAIAGIVSANTSLSGSYQIRVRSQGAGGSSNISQDGDFDAAPGAPATVGEVTLSNNGANYSVTLAIDAGGTSLQCEKTLHGTI